jgi:hypothetical protein
VARGSDIGWSIDTAAVGADGPGLMVRCASDDQRVGRIASTEGVA